MRDCFSMAVWPLAQSAMQPGAHLMFQSAVRFSFGPHFSFAPAYRFYNVCSSNGSLSWAAHHWLVVMIITALVAQFASVLQRSTSTCLSTHPTPRWHRGLKLYKKLYLNKKIKPTLEEQTAPCLACYDNSSLRSACFMQTTFCSVHWQYVVSSVATEQEKHIWLSWYEKYPVNDKYIYLKK